MLTFEEVLSSEEKKRMIEHVEEGKFWKMVYCIGNGDEVSLIISKLIRCTRVSGTP